MKIVFFGTSNFALPILEALNQHHQIAAVVTAPDAPVGRKQEFSESPVSALAKDLKLTTLKPEMLKGNQEFLEQLAGLNAEMFVVASYGKILPAEFVTLPPHKTLNVHPSLLPKYRGASPIQYALLNGDNKTGTSIMLMDEQMDHGPVLAQEEVIIDSDDSFFTLSDRLARVSAQLLVNTVPGYVDESIQPRAQDDNQAVLTKILTKQDGRIVWQKTAAEIHNQFRAFYPWPGIWTTWNGKMLKITDCRIADRSENSQLPGTVLDGGVAACGQNTFLQINSLQLEGKNETSIADFLNGYRDFAGSKLE
jgi:methionyl-tRNA formyltransferase